MAPKILSIVNSKGGVAKTTSCVNLCAGLSLLGKSVLGVDLDPQANFTHSLIGDLEEDAANITEVILGKASLKSIIRSTHLKNFDIAPAGESMVNLDLQLQSTIGREHKLKQVLSDKFLDKYDFIVIDNSPHVSLKTVNSLVASHAYICPVSAEYLPLVGIKHLLKIIEEIKPINPEIRNAGFLITMSDKREGISSDVEKILRETFPDEVFKSLIRINTKLKACPQKRMTIFDMEKPSGKGFTDYMCATKELLTRVGS